MRTNGIMLSPDERTLYVTNGGSILAFDVQPDGKVTNRRDFAKLEGGNGDGMAIDAAGRLFVTSAPGVQVFSPDGKYLGTIPAPRSVISVAFSGPDKKTLYVVGSGVSKTNAASSRGPKIQYCVRCSKLHLTSRGPCSPARALGFCISFSRYCGHPAG